MIWLSWVSSPVGICYSFANDFAVHGGKLKGKAIIVVDNEQIEHEKKLGAKF